MYPFNTHRFSKQLPQMFPCGDIHFEQFGKFRSGRNPNDVIGDHRRQLPPLVKMLLR